MNKPRFITFTGPDDHTDVGRMVELSKRFPIEWAFLLSPKRQGQGRFASLDFIRYAIWADIGPKAFHLCGAHARDVLANGHTACADLFYDLLQVQRVQINTADPNIDMLNVNDFGEGIGHKRIILQTRGEFPKERKVDWLYDCSGGRGTLAESWPVGTGYLVGYAGGIGPDNVREVVTAINDVCTGPYWIDMETNVRTDDVFDLNKVEAVCRAVYGDKA